MQVLPLLVCVLLGADPAAVGAAEGATPGAKAGRCGTIRARGPIRAIGTARPSCWPRTASTWSCPTCSGAAWPITPATCCPAAPRSGKYGDQIEQCCAAAKKYGIEVHVWKVNFNLVTAPKDFVEKLRREGRTQVTRQGQADATGSALRIPTTGSWSWRACWRSPASTRSTVCTSTTSAIPAGEYCYCDGCRRRFEAESGRKVVDRLAEGVLLRRSERGVQRLALPADHRAGGGGQPRGEEDPAGAENLGGRVRLVSRLPRVGRPGLAGVDQGGLPRFRLPDGLHRRATRTSPRWCGTR